MRRGLSEKIAILVALLIAASLATTTAINIWSGQQLLEEQSRQRAVDIANLLAGASSNYLYDLRADEVETLTEEVENQHEVLFAYVLDADGMLLTESDLIGERYTIIDDPLSHRAHEAQETMVMADEVGFHVATPVFLGSENLGIARITLSRASLDRNLASLTIRSSLLGLAFLIIGLITSRSFLMRTVRPLRELTTATKAIADGEHHRRISIVTGDEVQELADAFNQMTMSLNAKDAALTQRIDDLALVQQQLRVANQDLEGRVAERTRELEAALVTAQEATRLKSEFLANMSHEIRTPINGVLGMAELLTKSPLEGKQKHFAHTILGSAQSLLGTINDILDFSKIEAGRLDLDSAPFDLRILVEDVVQQLGTIAHRKHLELICDVELDVPDIVRGDAQRLRQVLVNLVGNAIKFTDQGQVTVKVQRPPTERHGELLFEVIDTGIGIAPDAQARIFDSFAQADGSTSRQFGGTGLGLAISQKLVSLMGGAIGVESDVGRGAIFRFMAEFEWDRSASNTEATVEAFENLRVLVLDDNATNLDILDRRLEAWHLPHDCVADGQTALDFLRRARIERYPYHVVLVDRFMPGMDGFDFARLVRENGDIAETKLVLLSSMTADKTSNAWREAAFSYSLTKPLRQADLYQCLRNLDQGQCPCTAASEKEAVETIPETRFAASILVAEDNPVNQDLIQETLWQLGCQVDLVEDGAAAIQAFEGGHHDLIFMDCQMPRVDGFQATKVIRDLERGNGNLNHTPVIALTANAMEGDREKCLAAGMDDYLTKPFIQADLIAILSRWASVSGDATPVDVGVISADIGLADEAPRDIEMPGVIDPAALARVRQMAGSKGDDLLIKIIGRYLERTPEQLQDLAAAADRSDYDEVRMITHGLKSSSANLGAVMLSELCKDVETACRIGQVDQVQENVQKIVADFDNVESALRGELERIGAPETVRPAASATVH